MIVAASDAALYGAWLAAAAAVIPSLLAYRRGRRADDRSLAVTELELTVRTMQTEIDRRDRELERVRGRLDACEEDRRHLWRELGKIEGGHA